MLEDPLAAAGEGPCTPCASCAPCVGVSGRDAKGVELAWWTELEDSVDELALCVGFQRLEWRSGETG